MTTHRSEFTLMQGKLTLQHKRYEWDIIIIIIVIISCSSSNSVSSLCATVSSYSGGRYVRTVGQIICHMLCPTLD